MYIVIICALIVAGFIYWMRRRAAEKDLEIQRFSVGLERVPEPIRSSLIPEPMPVPEPVVVYDDGVPPPPHFIWEAAQRPIPSPRSLIPPPPDFIREGRLPNKPK